MRLSQRPENQQGNLTLPTSVAVPFLTRAVTLPVPPADRTADPITHEFDWLDCVTAHPVPTKVRTIAVAAILELSFMTTIHLNKHAC